MKASALAVSSGSGDDAGEKSLPRGSSAAVSRRTCGLSAWRTGAKPKPLPPPPLPPPPLKPPLAKLARLPAERSTDTSSKGETGVGAGGVAGGLGLEVALLLRVLSRLEVVDLGDLVLWPAGVLALVVFVVRLGDHGVAAVRPEPARTQTRGLLARLGPLTRREAPRRGRQSRTRCQSGGQGSSEMTRSISRRNARGCRVNQYL